MARANISPLIRAQVEKLTASGGGVGGGITSERRNINSTSPIIIPKKPLNLNTTSQNSASYTSSGDQMSSSAETLLHSHHESDDAFFTSLPLLPSNSQQLEHSAARDRIAVKNKRRQASREKSKTDDNQISSSPQIESKSQPQPVIDQSDLDAVRSHLRSYSRDRSTDKKPSTSSSSIQRSVTFKHTHEIKLINRSRIVPPKDDDDEEEEGEEHKDQSLPRSSSPEHIYDNLDIFQRDKLTTVKKRELPSPTPGRLRPVTMHISTTNDPGTVNEFGNVLNQLKNRSLVKKVIPVSSLEEPVQSPPVPVEEPLVSPSTENESIVPSITSTNKMVENPSTLQTPNRRRTVGGVHLPANNKVAVVDNKPVVSWIDIAKQKQSKFQSVSMEKPHEEESESPQITPVVSRKQVTMSSNITKVKENTSVDVRFNRKSMYEPAITRRLSPSPASLSKDTNERDSIRALKSANPNRINNLIQFFDK